MFFFKCYPNGLSYKFDMCNGYKEDIIFDEMQSGNSEWGGGSETKLPVAIVNKYLQNLRISAVWEYHS